MNVSCPNKGPKDKKLLDLALGLYTETVFYSYNQRSETFEKKISYRLRWSNANEKSIRLR